MEKRVHVGAECKGIKELYRISLQSLRSTGKTRSLLAGRCLFSLAVESPLTEPAPSKFPESRSSFGMTRAIRKIVFGEPIMRNMRKHTRFKLDVIDLNSRMSTVGNVEIIDISAGGIALKADRKLNIGKEHLIMLGYEGKQFNVKGVVVRSELSGIEERADGEKITIYSAGILFKDESAGKVKDFLDSIGNSRKTQVPERIDWFYRDIKFSITTPTEKVLNLPSQFGVKEISQSGIIIQTDRQLKIGGIVLMELAISAGEPASFMGKVVSCRTTQDTVNVKYDIGVEFSELTDRDRSLIRNFIDCVKEKGSAAGNGEIKKG